MEKKPLTTIVKYMYGFADFGFSFVSSIENYYMMFFLTDIAKLPLAGISAATSLAYTLDTPSQAVYGALISTLKPMRWGRNRSWFLLFPPLVMLTFILLFTNIGSPSVALVICGTMLYLTNGTRSLSWLANLNMINVLASNPDERSMLAARRATWSAAAGIVFAYTVNPAINTLTKTLNPVYAYTIVAGAAGAFYTLTSWFVFWITSGYEATGAEAKAQAQAPGQQVTFMDIIRSAVQNPYLLILLLCDFFRQISATTVTSSAAYYFKYVALNPNLMSPYQVAYNFAGLIGASLSAGLAKKYTTKRAAIIGMIGMIIGNLTGSIFGMNPIWTIACVSVARFFISLAQANLVALYGDCVVYARWKTGKDTSAFVMGSQTIPLKIGLTLRGIILPAVLAFVGFNPNIPPADATDQVRQGIITMFMRIPAIGYLGTVLVLTFAFRLTNERVNEMQREIDEREAAAKLATAN